jgi:hypothetical protein
MGTANGYGFTTRDMARVTDITAPATGTTMADGGMRVPGGWSAQLGLLDMDIGVQAPVSVFASAAEHSHGS